MEKLNVGIGGGIGKKKKGKQKKVGDGNSIGTGLRIKSIEKKKGKKETKIIEKKNTIV